MTAITIEDRFGSSDKVKLKNDTDIWGNYFSGNSIGLLRSGLSGEVFDTTKAADTLSEKAQQILGENGVQRYEQFKLYVAGWDSGDGQVLSSHSTAILEKFLNTFDSFPDEPSIFFTRNGNLQLGWEDLQSNVLELEFFPDKIEYYIASNDKEGEVDTSQDSIARFCDMLTSL